MILYVPTLLESRRPAAARGAVGGGALSFAAHAALIAAAVYGTMATTRAVVERHLVVDVALPVTEQAPPPPSGLRDLGRPPTGFRTLEIPTTVLTEIPPPSQAPFDPAAFSGVGLAAVAPAAPAAPRAAPASRDVYTVEMVEELPVRRSGASPEYPPLLRSAGITGEVRLEFIIDTAGRVEPGSARVLSSTHPLFEAPSLRALDTWQFQPGRIGGMKVRVRVRQLLRFG